MSLPSEEKKRNISGCWCFNLCKCFACIKRLSFIFAHINSLPSITYHNSSEILSSLTMALIDFLAFYRYFSARFSYKCGYSHYIRTFRKGFTFGYYSIIAVICLQRFSKFDKIRPWNFQEASKYLNHYSPPLNKRLRSSVSFVELTDVFQGFSKRNDNH